MQLEHLYYKNMAKELTLFDKYLKELKEIANCNNCTELDDDIWGNYEVYGCTNPSFPDYNPAANIDNGSCGTAIMGCMNPKATNYDPTATMHDDSCVFPVYGCTDATATNFDATATVDDGSCIYNIYGCTDATASNYNSAVTVDDGSCIYNIYGCTDSIAYNYNSAATVDDGSCLYGTSNCANNQVNTYNLSTFHYINYNPSALFDCNSELLGTVGDSSTGLQSAGYDSCCTAHIYGCTDFINASNYNPNATSDDGSCIAFIYGCTDASALNYYAGANADDGSCCYVSGCTDSTANNYDATACMDDNSCLYCTSYGCTDPTATNYNAAAVCDDGSCTYGPCVGTINVYNSLQSGTTNVGYGWELWLENNGYGNGIPYADGLALKSAMCTETVIEILSAYQYGIKGFQGVEGFVALTDFTFVGGELEGGDGPYDFSSNINLVNLRIDSNSGAGANPLYWSGLDISGCTLLETLFMYKAGYDGTLDVSNNTALTAIYTGYNNKLDGITGLASLSNLVSIDLSRTNVQNPDLSSACGLLNFSAYHSAATGQNLGNVTLCPTLDLTLLNSFTTSKYPAVGNTQCVVKVGAGDVPGTSGGTGAGGLQTRVEYMQANYTTASTNQLTKISALTTFAI